MEPKDQFQKFLETYPDVMDLLWKYRGFSNFIDSVASQLLEMGTLTYKQIAAVRNIEEWPLRHRTENAFLMELDFSELLEMLIERRGRQFYVAMGLSITATDRKDGIYVRRLDLTPLGKAFWGTLYGRPCMTHTEISSLSLSVEHPHPDAIIGWKDWQAVRKSVRMQVLRNELPVLAAEVDAGRMRLGAAEQHLPYRYPTID